MTPTIAEKACVKPCGGNCDAACGPPAVVRQPRVRPSDEAVEASLARVDARPFLLSTTSVASGAGGCCYFI